MKARRGFTLLEVMIAIIITSVVALLAYGTAAAGFDTEQRLARFRATTGTYLNVRTFLIDALRHPHEQGGPFMNDELLALDDGLRFLSKKWIIELRPGNQGVTLRATPLDTAVLTPVVWTLPDANGLRIQVLDRTTSSEWQTEWHALGRLPAAVKIEFASVPGAPAIPPIVAHTALERIY